MKGFLRRVSEITALSVMCVFFVPLHVQSQATSASRTFKAPALMTAKLAFSSSMEAARRAYSQSLETALKGAMSSNNLAEANSINSIKVAVDTGGLLPQADFKTATAVQAKSAYEAAIAKSRAQYMSVLQAAQKSVLASGDLAEANKIQEEVTEIGGPPPDAAANVPAGASVLESADVLVSGTGFTVGALEDNNQAWGNRGYKWAGVPASIKGWKYTKTRGGTAAEIKVRAKRDTTVLVITDVTEPQTRLSGWSRTKDKFTSTENKSDMRVFEKKIAAGQEVKIPQLNWCGTLVVVPAQ